MDIDEFLNKETKGEEKVSVDKSPVIEETKEDDHIDDSSNPWDKLSKVKFKWDSKLYQEINEEGNKSKKELDKALTNVSRDKKEIKRLIGKALTELESNNHEGAAKIYSEISDLRDKFPDYLLQDKKDLNKEILLLYGKLHDQIDLKFISDFEASIRSIRDQSENAFSNMDAGDIAKAKVLYQKALDDYKNLPNGFMDEKIELGKGLLRLYKDLSIRTQIEELEQQLSKRASGNFAYEDNDYKMRQLSKIVHEKAASGEHHSSNTLLPRLVARKLDRAKINIDRGLFLEAKKNIDAVLKIDPENEEAREMENSLPVQY